MMEDHQHSEPVPLKEIKVEGEQISTFYSDSEFPFFRDIKTEIKEEIQTFSEDVIEDICELQVDKSKPKLSRQPTILPQNKNVSDDFNLKIDKVFYTDKRLIYKQLIENSPLSGQNGVSGRISKNDATVLASKNSVTMPAVRESASKNSVTVSAATVSANKNSVTLSAATVSASKNSVTVPAATVSSSKNHVTFPDGSKVVIVPASTYVPPASAYSILPDKYSFAKLLKQEEKTEVSGELNLQIDKVFSINDRFNKRQPPEHSTKSGHNGEPEPASNHGVPKPTINNGVPEPACNNGVSEPASNNSVKIPVSLAARNKKLPNKFAVSKLLKLAPKVSIPSQLNNILVPLQNSFSADFISSQNHSIFLTHPVCKPPLHPVSNSVPVSQQQFLNVKESNPQQIIVLPNFNLLQSPPSSTPPTQTINNYKLLPEHSELSCQNGKTVPATNTNITNNYTVAQSIKLAPEFTIPPWLNNNCLQNNFLPANMSSSHNHITVHPPPISKPSAHPISNSVSSNDNDSELQPINLDVKSLQKTLCFAKINSTHSHSTLLTQPINTPSTHSSNNCAPVIQKQASDVNVQYLQHMYAGSFQSTLLTTGSEVPVLTTSGTQKSYKGSKMLMSNGTTFPLACPVSAASSTLIPSFLQADIPTFPLACPVSAASSTLIPSFLQADIPTFPLACPVSSAASSTLIPSFLQANIPTVTSSAEPTKLPLMKPGSSLKISQENSIKKLTLKNNFLKGITRLKTDHETKRRKRKLQGISHTADKHHIVVGQTKAQSHIVEPHQPIYSLENYSTSSNIQNPEVFTSGTYVCSGDENLPVKKSLFCGAKVKTLVEGKPVCDQTIDKESAGVLLVNTGLGILSSQNHQNEPSSVDKINTVQNENLPESENMFQSVLKMSYDSDIYRETLRPCVVCLQKLSVGLNDTVLLQHDTGEVGGFKYYVQKDIFLNSNISTHESVKLFQYYGDNSEMNKLGKSAAGINEHQVLLDSLGGDLATVSGKISEKDCSNEEDLNVEHNVNSNENDYNYNRKTTINDEKTQSCLSHAEHLDHYSSESDSDMFGESSASNPFTFRESDLHISHAKKIFLKNHKEVTLFLVKYSDKFTIGEGKKEYCCSICHRYKTNGLFKLKQHLNKHVQGTLKCCECLLEYCCEPALANHKIPLLIND